MRVDRAKVINWSFLVGAVALIGRAAWVQLWQGERWTRAARGQQEATDSLPAPRGTIRDASGTVLAESRELVTLEINLAGVKDREAVAKALLRAGAGEDWARRVRDPRRKWLAMPQHFLPDDVADLAAMRGVTAKPVAERVYLESEAIRRLVGRATPTRGLDGLEFALDSLLRGTPGSAQLLRDARGRTMAPPGAVGDTARHGHAITLTINHPLQDIAERALRDALQATQADGGDIVVLDPADGAVLAMASRRRDPRSTAATALTEPFEPGSTLKPFVAGRLLDLRRARAEEVVPTFNGRMTIGKRTITDVHRAERMTLAEVIEQSSNIGIVQFAARLAPREQYELLRDLGFGTPTGVPYPLEAAGLLREPRRWSATSAASLAMGYEISVTALQLAVAYAAVANGGEMLQPALVREIRSPEGEVVWQHRRRALRRVFSPAASAEVRRMLRGVVQDGTAGGADLSTYDVGGKSGTARRVARGRYAAGAYTASFVGLFPADAPTLVVVVKLDNPQGAYYGGRTAAPVFKAVVEGALASRDALPDRASVAAAARPAPPAPETGAPRESLLATTTPVDTGDVPVVVELGLPRASAPAGAERPVPDVRGLSARAAILRLHQAGFRVQVERGEAVDPAPGSLRPPGTVVRLGVGDGR